MTEYKILTEEDPEWVEDKMNELAQLGFTLKEFTATRIVTGDLHGTEQTIAYTAVMMRHQ